MSTEPAVAPTPSSSPSRSHRIPSPLNHISKYDIHCKDTFRAAHSHMSRTLQIIMQVMELLHDRYLNEEPLPVPISELRVPSARSAQHEGSPGERCDHRETDSDSDIEISGPVNVTKIDTGFSIQFSSHELEEHGGMTKVLSHHVLHYLNQPWEIIIELAMESTS
ncbi:hypothetical protein F0562_009554 [Nyssa sinensis]|uniref:Uncharacterized protein n=1 Tax=Nyssa sinensis TaxID=561372 RepID=A0A5J5A190_9ASTE|nr:hypothetical protein F0562_009554 [Nyssa sinensis]